MKYFNIIKGFFKSRPNRFIAIVEMSGEDVICHVKNTGRCKELLVEGATVYLQKADNPNRKTLYDVIAVQKGDMLINIDSQIVNGAALEYMPVLFDNIRFIKPECVYGNSRFDIYLETETDKIFVEVKGVTLEKDGVALFPDAPTERGVKHLKELQNAVADGYKAFVLFVIQMDNISHFEPNKETHPEFAEELKNAQKNGVTVLAYSCAVTPDEIKIKDKVKVIL